MTDNEWTQLLADRQQLSVARVIAVPTLLAIARTPRACGTLAISGLWVRDQTGPCGKPEHACVRVSATLRIGRRRPLPIVVELAPWSEQTTELVLRPTARRAYQWSLRRRSRWYAAAHGAADDL